MSILEQLLGKTKYPTKEEIMNNPMKHKKEVIQTLKEFKKLPHPNGITYEDLYGLLTCLSSVYNKPLYITNIPPQQGCSYDPINKTIHLDNSNSIISALHEFGHHLYGSSETKACRWSVWLFKKVYPKAFTLLEWKGHLLVRQNKPTTI
jgi:hypothetical protein